MVDMATYNLMYPTTNTPPRSVPQMHPMRQFGAGPPRLITDVIMGDQESVKLDPWPLKVYKSEEISDKMVMLLPSTIFGFRLQAKKWSEQVPALCYVYSDAALSR